MRGRLDLKIHPQKTLLYLIILHNLLFLFSERKIFSNDYLLMRAYVCFSGREDTYINFWQNYY